MQAKSDSVVFGGEVFACSKRNSLLERVAACRSACQTPIGSSEYCGMAIRAVGRSPHIYGNGGITVGRWLPPFSVGA